MAARRTPVGASSAMIWGEGVTGMAGGSGNGEINRRSLNHRRSPSTR